MNELIHIGNSDITIKEYKGQRVVTFKDIDSVHGRVEGTARKRFADNKSRLIENEDFFVVKPSDLENIEVSEKRTLENVVLNNYGTALMSVMMKIIHWKDTSYTRDMWCLNLLERRVYKCRIKQVRLFTHIRDLTRI